jgi:hypothetical protein
MSTTDPQPFLSRKDFAALKGWSKSYVTKLGQQRRLVLSDDGKLVDVAATNELLAQANDPGKAHVVQRHAAARVDRDVGQHTRPDAPADEPPGGGRSIGAADGADPGYWENKTRREAALATMAEVELMARLDKLVDRAAVESSVEALHRMLRDSLMGLPTRLAPEFAAMTDAFAIEQKFRDAVRRLLDDLSKMSAQDLKGSGSRH